MLQPDPKSSDDIKKPYLRAANLDWSGVKLEDVKEMWFSPQDLKKYKLEPSDVLVSEGGDVGRASFWNDSIEMYIQNAINRLRPITDESNPKFLYYWFSF
jgi:type I restriction enzyme S subunit